MTRHFEKWARKERIGNADLGAVIQAADAGLIHADLKGCLVKIRLARQGAGKSSGYRTIIAYKKDERAFFLYGFSKGDRANISSDEINGLEEYGEILMELPIADLNQLISEGKLREIL